MKKAPEVPAPHVPGMITHEVDATGLPRDYVDQVRTRLTQVHGCLCNEHDGKLTVFAPQSCGPEFGGFVQKMLEPLKRDMENFEEVVDKFARPINEQAQQNVRGVLHNLSSSSIGMVKGPHILDLEVTAEGWRALVRTCNTGVMHGAKYETFLERVRGTVKAAIESAYSFPFW